MSWSVSYPSTDAFLKDLPGHSSISNSNPEIQRAVLEQLSIGRILAKNLIDSGAVGKSCDFAINLYGHANAAHQPTQGWANDTVTVSVSQKSPDPSPAGSF